MLLTSQQVGKQERYGIATISDVNDTSDVTFGVMFTDDQYVVGLTPENSGDNVASVNVWFSNRTSTGFRIHVSMAPGAGNSLNVHWRAVHL